MNVALTLEGEWYKQMEEAKKAEICEPRLQFVFLLKNELIDNQYGVPVKKCPRGCGTCRDVNHTCHSTATKNVTKVALFKEHPDDDDFTHYRNVTIEEDIACLCVLPEKQNGTKDTRGSQECGVHEVGPRQG